MKQIEALVMLACVLGCANRDTQTPPADARTDSSPAAAATDAYLVSSSGVGPIRLSMTIGEARRALPTATFTRTSDGDGLALVEVTLGVDTSLTLFADEADPESPIDSSRKITRIETFSPAFHTVEGVRPGALVTDIEAVFGKTREIVKSDIESREFIDFERQPAFLTIRLDYAGVFAVGANRTKEYRPGAKILSIAVPR